MASRRTHDVSPKHSNDPRKGLQDEKNLCGRKTFLMVSLSNHAICSPEPPTAD